MRTRIKKQTVSDRYLQCVIEFPLKVIKSERQHDEAVAQIGRLMVRGNLDAGEEEYVEALARLIGDYEDRAGHRIKVSTRDPIKIP